MSPKICRCHGVAMLRTPRQYYCVIKQRANNLHAARRYRATAKGRAATKSANDRRVYIGRRAVTHAAAPAQAHAINTYVRSSVRAFVHRSQEDSVRESR